MANKLALGTVQFGLPYGVANSVGQPSLEEIRRILEVARSSGIDTLDTARAYGDSERRLGICNMVEWRVVTKLPDRHGTQRVSDWAESCLRQSLAELKTSKVEALLLHRSALLLSADGHELYSTLQSLKEAGLVSKIGVSVYRPEELDMLVPGFGFDLVQLPLNVLDRRFLKSGWLARLADRRIEVHARSCFLQGLLLVEAGKLPDKFSRWAPLWEKWTEWLRESKQSALQACLGFLQPLPEIHRVLVGVDSEQQLQEILAAAQAPSIPPPSGLYSDDPDLINPSRWNLL
jgi:aryl-alcohol dehydrogenase-like predicted oxidoreductase